MRCVHFLVTAVLALVAGGAIPSISVGGDDDEAGRRPHAAVICGPNVLYMFLNAHDQPVTADTLFQEVDPGDQGLSLLDLRDASTRYGLSAEVRRCTYEQLVKGCPLPAVALLQPEFKTAGRNGGHYVLLVDADEDGVSLIDGTSGEEDRYSRDMFCRDWKGHVVVPARLRDWPLLVTTVVGWGVGGWLILRENSLDTRPR